MTRPIFAAGLGTSPRGPQGLPGINAIPAKDAVDAYNAALIDDETSATSDGLTDFVGRVVGNGSAFVEAVETILVGPGTGPKIGNELAVNADFTHFPGVVVDGASLATVACRIAKFQVRFDTALTGRQVEFYILSHGSGTTYTPTYASGLVDAPATGVLTWNTLSNNFADMQVGDVLGIWCSAADQPDAPRVAQSGGSPIPGAGPLQWAAYQTARLSVGVAKSSWAGASDTANYILNLSATPITGGLRVITTDNIGQYSDTSAWVGKTISAVGTSITNGTGANLPISKNGYLGQLPNLLGAVIDDQAAGSSGIVWDGTRALSLGATRAQLTAAGFDPSQSYETKVLGRTSDLLILDHAFNDRDRVIGSINDTTAATFYGAYNVVIQAKLAENPLQRFMFLTPVTVFSPTEEDYVNGQPGTVATRLAVLALAKKYAFPVLDWTFALGINYTTKVQYHLDNVHPNQEIHNRAARMLTAFIKTL